MKRQWLQIALPMALMSAAALARPQGGDDVFEAASVKRNVQSGVGGLQSLRVGPGDRVTAVNVTLRTLLQAAHELAARNIVGGPGWLDTDRFDVTAKASEPTSNERLRRMLQALLTERFKIVAAVETRDQPTYALVLANANQRLGPQLKRATENCATLRASMPVRPGGRGGEQPCGIVRRVGELAARGLPLSQLAGMMSYDARRTVTDETGLAGDFDWRLTYTPPTFLERPFDRQRFPQIDPDGPSIFTAVQEQLGLKLESREGPGRVLALKQVQNLVAN